MLKLPAFWHRKPVKLLATRSTIANGEKVVRPANIQKIVVMHSLLDLLHDDDVNAVYTAIHTAMAGLDFNFAGEPSMILNQIERENRDA